MKAAHVKEAAEEIDSRDEVRARIIAAAADLLADGGREALTTRAVAEAAGVQAPTMYRLFGDKSGLLDAVAEHGFARYVAEKKVRKIGRDPVEDLRSGWDLHIGFGLANPAVYGIIYGDPRPGVTSKAAAAGYRVLEELIRRIAAAGQLRVNEERAAELVHAAGCGTVLSLLAMPEDRRNLGLSKSAREAVIQAITTGQKPTKSLSPASAAIALRALLPNTKTLTSGERHLFLELLDRLARESE